MLPTADEASPSGRAHNSEQGHSLKMADEISDALQNIDARVALIETTLYKVDARTASIETVLNEVERDISGMKMRLERIEHYTGLVTPLPS
jgi:archaellum component FlaC